MSALILYNGIPTQADAPIATSGNRAFRYGDGLFESMRLSSGKLRFADAHADRMGRTARFLGMDVPAALQAGGIAHAAESLGALNGLENARVRLQVYRSGEGTFRPTGTGAEWLMECSPMESAFYALNAKGLLIGLYKDCRVPQPPIGSHKTCNSLPYVLASQYAGNQGWDDALMLNSKGYVAEAATANLFLVKGREMLTPSLTHGGLPGIMRQAVAGIARSLGYTVKVAPVGEEEMRWADECLLTNAVSGIRWVGAYGQKRYLKKAAIRVTEVLNRAVPVSSGAGPQAG